MIRVVIALLVVSLFHLPAVGAPVQVTDGMGRTLVLAHPPQRIISLTPSVTEILYALGLASRVAAVTINDHYPPEVSLKPTVGDIHPNFEKILSLHPDLVVLEGTMSPATVERLDQLHLPVLALNSATLDGFRQSVHLVAEATGTTTQAASLLSNMDRRLAAVARRVRQRPTSPRVFVEVWDQPLQTAGGGTFLDEVIRRAGGLNCFADLTSHPVVSPEALVARNPDIIILTTSDVSTFGHRPGFGLLKAVQAGQIHKVDPDTLVRPSFRLADGVEQLYRLFSAVP